MISESVVNSLKKASWIRAMFEEGEKLRKIHGPTTFMILLWEIPTTNRPLR